MLYNITYLKSKSRLTVNITTTPNRHTDIERNEWLLVGRRQRGGIRRYKLLCINIYYKNILYGTENIANIYSNYK